MSTSWPIQTADARVIRRIEIRREMPGGNSDEHDQTAAGRSDIRTQLSSPLPRSSPDESDSQHHDPVGMIRVFYRAGHSTFLGRPWCLIVDSRPRFSKVKEVLVFVPRECLGVLYGKRRFTREFPTASRGRNDESSSILPDPFRPAYREPNFQSSALSTSPARRRFARHREAPSAVGHRPGTGIP